MDKISGGTSVTENFEGLVGFGGGDEEGDYGGVGGVWVLIGAVDVEVSEYCGFYFACFLGV